MPYAAYSGIKELFVPEEKIEEAKQEAERLPAVEINKVTNMKSAFPAKSFMFGKLNNPEVTRLQRGA